MSRLTRKERKDQREEAEKTQHSQYDVMPRFHTVSPFKVRFTTILSWQSIPNNAFDIAPNIANIAPLVKSRRWQNKNRTSYEILPKNKMTFLSILKSRSRNFLKRGCGGISPQTLSCGREK